MSGVVMTVTNIEWPQLGKKQGRITDSTGKQWGVWADKINHYQLNQTYEVTFDTNEFKGKTYYVLKTATPVNGSRPPMNGGGAPSNPTRVVVDNSKPFPSDDSRRMDIYICGGLNNMMANPNIKPLELTAGDIANLTTKLKQAWKLTLGPQAQEANPAGSTNEFYNDAIPDFN